MLSQSRRLKAIAPKRPRVGTSSPLLPARCNHAHGRGETIALGLGSADAIGKAIARRITPGSSCMTTAQPGLRSRPPRPAGRLLAWQSNRGASGARTVEAIVPAIEPDDRYPGIPRREATHVGASISRHCDGAPRDVS